MLDSGGGEAIRILFCARSFAWVKGFYRLQPTMRCFLVDNGSLRIDSWCNLCAVAAAVSEIVGIHVEPASVLHSSRIPAEQVPEGVPQPITWERAVKAAMGAGETTIWTLPFFFGPTGAIVDYLPQREALLRERVGALTVHYAPFLADPLENESLGLEDLLVDRVQETIRARGLTHPPVILVDHGSPRREVAAVRNRVAAGLDRRLGDRVFNVQAASKERREGAAYAFNEPLLESLLCKPPFNRGDVVVAQMFLSPGRHAGEGGDIDRICSEAERNQPGLQTFRTALLGTHPAMPELVAARFHALRASVGSGRNPEV